MARSSISGADRAPTQAPGRDVEALGPSDSSDSGSDVQGELDLVSPLDPDTPTEAELTDAGDVPALDEDEDGDDESA
jgi:hypothetical protein